MNDGTTRFTCRGQSIKHNMVIKINYVKKQTNKQKQPANILLLSQGMFDFQRIYRGLRD